MANKPSIPKGTRDFGPTEMAQREYIFSTIKSVFRQYGFQPIETPTMENLETLTGKYGDEGDKLIFKILDSGDYLSNAPAELLANKESRSLTKHIAEKALRYDLTVPFARYVVQHNNEITLPFKRYQIQPVWRADRPQKGRYREFYQCDADIVGSKSLLIEAELIHIYDQALSKLGLKDFTIKINNRKLLAAMAEYAGCPEKMMDITIAIDKLDKIGLDGVNKEMLNNGISEDVISKLQAFLSLEGNSEEQLAKLSPLLGQTEIGKLGLAEITEVFELIKANPLSSGKLEFDFTLARGLNYYTGAIFEVKANGVQMGSIGGGGRYDDLTGIFGLKDLTGIGISFGADRIYDVMMELQLFQNIKIEDKPELLVAYLDEEVKINAFKLSAQLRALGLKVDLYPDQGKIKKYFDFAEKKGIPYLLFIGKTEVEQNLYQVKHLASGEQKSLSPDQIKEFVQQ